MCDDTRNARESQALSVKVYTSKMRFLFSLLALFFGAVACVSAETTAPTVTHLANGALETPSEELAAKAKRDLQVDTSYSFGEKRSGGGKVRFRVFVNGTTMHSVDVYLSFFSRPGHDGKLLY